MLYEPLRWVHRLAVRFINLLVRCYTLTPSFATFAASTYRSGIAGLFQPPASCSRSLGVPFRAAFVVHVRLRSCALEASRCMLRHLFSRE